MQRAEQMEGTPIVLPKPLQDNLEAIAKNQDKTVSDLVQEALNLYVFALQRVQAKSVGLGESEYSDLSERVDDLLWQEP
ncbi:hypothetical protein [Synechococcus sp. PCC 6312]|uniref:hypothetical protein n=1 Tax=Synechococcus sp. (strain ATCC 27167 / PCC 6312) TaxID=195253 RepID=UPI00029F3D70|nr:hypothetical protein [Synechococcus sp. PCC 6312]AFY62381.1 hypothetical protein Syn6312_3345 [Synechococcus sp. PCC 6312]